jgi:hypothetical protein
MTMRGLFTLFFPSSFLFLSLASRVVGVAALGSPSRVAMLSRGRCGAGRNGQIRSSPAAKKKLEKARVCIQRLTWCLGRKWGNLKKKSVPEKAISQKGGHFDSADWAMQAKKAQGGAGAAKKPLPAHLLK